LEYVIGVFLYNLLKHALISKVRNNMCLLFIYDFAISIKLFSGLIKVASHLIKQNLFFAYLYNLMIECFFFFLK